MQKFIAKLIPFFLLGMVIVLLVAGIILISYLLIAGAVVGCILFLITFFRDLITRRPKKNSLPKNNKKGKIIDHDEL